MIAPAVTAAGSTTTAAGEETTAGAAAIGTTSSKKRVIAVDIDEVLGKFVLQLCAFHNEKYPRSAAPTSAESTSAAAAAVSPPPPALLTPEHFVSYNFHEVWGGTREEADEKVRDFFQSPHFVDGIPAIDDAARVLRKHSHNYELHVVTSRQDILQDHTRGWIDQHYPGIFTELHFGNHFSTEGVVRSKPDLCRAVGAVAIIDDNIRYAAQCGAAGIPAFLFGDYAWNRTSEPLPENVRRTVSWAEVDAELDSILSNGSNSGSGDGTSNGGGSSSSSSNGCKANGHTAAAAATGAGTKTSSGVGVSAGVSVGAGVSGPKTPTDGMEEGGAGETLEPKKGGKGGEERRAEA